MDTSVRDQEKRSCQDSQLCKSPSTVLFHPWPVDEARDHNFYNSDCSVKIASPADDPATAHQKPSQSPGKK